MAGGWRRGWWLWLVAVADGYGWWLVFLFLKFFVAICCFLLFVVAVCCFLFSLCYALTDFRYSFLRARAREARDGFSLFLPSRPPRRRAKRAPRGLLSLAFSGFPLLAHAFPGVPLLSLAFSCIASLHVLWRFLLMVPWHSLTHSPLFVLALPCLPLFSLVSPCANISLKRSRFPFTC